jgi:hypothetical protein
VSEKPVVEDELSKIKTELAKAKEETQRVTKELAALRRKRENKAAVTSNPPKEDPLPSTATEPKTDEHGHTEGMPHYVGSWQRYCPTCGDQNPEFKDETVCEDCGQHLGAKDLVQKLKACPNCGGHKAKAIS